VGFIHELHAALTRSQSVISAQDIKGEKVEVPLEHGKFKLLPNYPRRGDVVYQYCPPEQTASEMDRLVEMAQEYLEGQVPPEVLAAWLHHRFTQIHPYQDGNGRVARALATIVLVKAGLGPFTVDVQNKARYLDRLEDADRGDLRPLVLVVAREQDRLLQRIRSH
jgi:Fic family protein